MNVASKRYINVHEEREGCRVIASPEKRDWDFTHGVHGIRSVLFILCLLHRVLIFFYFLSFCLQTRGGTLVLDLDSGKNVNGTTVRFLSYVDQPGQSFWKYSRWNRSASTTLTTACSRLGFLNPFCKLTPVSLRKIALVSFDRSTDSRGPCNVQIISSDPRRPW